jgi:hypothetical protein
MFSDTEYIPSSAATATTINDYFTDGEKVTGFTDSKLTLVKTYKRDEPYIVDFDIDKTSYTGYDGTIIDGRTRVTSLSGPTGYTVDANLDTLIGTTGQTTGLLYNDFLEQRKVIDNDTGEEKSIGKTSFQIQGQGWNETNISLSALTKQEMFLGIISPPEVQSDVQIDRGVTTVMEPHLKLSEVESLEHLELYGNGYYNLIK